MFRSLAKIAILALAFMFSIGTSMAAGQPSLTAGAGTMNGNVLLAVPGAVGLFGVASTNVGATGAVTMTETLEGATIPGLTFGACQNNGTGGCLPSLGDPANVTTTIAAGATDHFLVGVVVPSNAPSTNPAVASILVTFTDSYGCVVGTARIGLEIE